MKKPSYYKRILHTLEELYKKQPACPIGKHLATALDGYGDMWALTDKEIFIALNKYAGIAEYETKPDIDIDTIIKDGIALYKGIDDDEYYLTDNDDNGDN